MISIPERKEEPLVLIKGKIKGKIGEELPPNLGIIATNNVSGAVVGAYRPLNDGSFTIIIPPGSNYTLSFQDDGTEFYSENIEVPPGAAYQEIEKAINLKDVTIKPTEEKPALDSLANTGTPITGEPGDKNLVLERMTQPAKEKEKEKEKDKDKTKEKIKDKAKHEQLAKVDQLNFEMHFKYNVTETDVNDKPFKEFVDNIMELYKHKGTVSLTIASSASNVPTKAFGGNKELSLARNNKIRDQLKKALKDKGVSEDKIVITKVKTVVDGPLYKNDYLKNKDEYEKYQYVKVTAN
jgi:hypothetical protein